VPEKVDVVDVFRRAEYAPDIAREAVEIGAKVLWLQTGIWNEEAYRIATEGGVEVVMGACIRTTSKRLGTEVAG
jgi:predicted CoA-binding protein